MKILKKSMDYNCQNEASFRKLNQRSVKLNRLVRPKEETTQTFFPNQLGYTKDFNRLADVRNREGALGLSVQHGFPGSLHETLYCIWKSSLKWAK